MSLTVRDTRPIYLSKEYAVNDPNAMSRERRASTRCSVSGTHLRTSCAVAVAAAAMVALGSVVPADAAGTTAGTQSVRNPVVHWKPCPKYSDKVLKWMWMDDPHPAKWRKLMARLDCGTLQVPLDYGNARGRWITIALTRLPATERARRLGSIAVNPGGPGGSGYLMPIEIAAEKPAAKLNKRYDLIGFDPRGVGYSSKVDCPSGAADEPSEGAITEQQARAQHARQVTANQNCARSHPAFLSALTTGNVARDLDRIRRALGERKLSYFGVSWGSWLGPVYRSLFPGKVGRMWVDSVAPPDPRLDQFEAMRQMATARDFSRMADWVARFDSSYGFGATGKQVEAALAQMRADFEAHPRKFTDFDMPVDGILIAVLSSDPSRGWPTVARVLADVRDATGPTAPALLKELFPPPEQSPPLGAPEQLNQTAGQAIFCNGDGGARDFESGWAAYQDRLKRYPVTGVLSMFMNPCAGWPLPAERIRLSPTRGSLVLSGHRYESVSPYEWTRDMQDAVGGRVFTVEDDVHGSALREPRCAVHIVTYFETGRLGARGCHGEPVPESPDDKPTGR